MGTLVLNITRKWFPILSDEATIWGAIKGRMQCRRRMSTVRKQLMAPLPKCIDIWRMSIRRHRHQPIWPIYGLEAGRARKIIWILDELYKILSRTPRSCKLDERRFVLARFAAIHEQVVCCPTYDLMMLQT